MPGQLFATLDRGERHLDSGLQLLIMLPAAQQFEAALQHGQHIIEVMRHAASQLAQRFHLLRLMEIGLCLDPPIHLAL